MQYLSQPSKNTCPIAPCYVVMGVMILGILWNVVFGVTPLPPATSFQAVNILIMFYI